MNLRSFNGPFRVVETNLSLAINTNTLVASENFDRVYLRIALCNAATTANVRTTPITAAGQGTLLSQNFPALILIWEEVGPLCGFQHFAFAPAVTPVSITEVIQDYERRNARLLTEVPDDAAPQPGISDGRYYQWDTSRNEREAGRDRRFRPFY